jgi:hypothetical protein
MATITTTQHQRTPVWMALAVAGALAEGGALGFAIDNSSSQPTTSTPSVSTFKADPWWVGAYQHYYKGMNLNQPQAAQRTFGPQL